MNVMYLKDLLCEAVNRCGVREELVNDYVREAHLYGSYMQEAVKEYLLALPTDKLFDAMAGGVRKSQIPKLTKYHLVDYAQEDFPFYAESMPNLYFTRDPFACLGNGVIISHMANEIRQRETLFADYIFRYHPIYKSTLFCCASQTKGMGLSQLRSEILRFAQDDKAQGFLPRRIFWKMQEKLRIGGCHPVADVVYYTCFHEISYSVREGSMFRGIEMEVVVIREALGL